ncbi:ethanolamine ammonia-lyase subunit EutB [Algoriphagus zhangzhouensis]|uniref:Ethanolamine ammonia-lyase light chain /Ethanolamine ammonia-lyase heavy chain n=1 Tax=Algoriphagus zhangzhouensis TaxID=1073327 RepID=A0A1M7ZDZ9_9BACT|nr:ethanolamine ammonia-lyase subunit EutB [Algoriphagus zhangzhouensis]TDY45926.1 ethanolamine ammonia-lyase light chain /ethanolamine ammonia-lyase heavy chain [Algoriphagus zhangzhouensis]SHO63107.1 Ethanolamine ammonia-lyase light chain /Ethanolamine ammonia-lyase heavy chain [Algoriphagus zhangzhouensis]
MNRKISRKEFLAQMGILGTSVVVFNSCGFNSSTKNVVSMDPPVIDQLKSGEDIFSYIKRTTEDFNQTLFRQIIGAANEFKEGDQTLGVAAESSNSRENARILLANTKVGDLNQQSLFSDELYDLIQDTTEKNPDLDSWTVGELKEFILTQPEESIKEIMPALNSDIIACVVKLMSNEELIQLGQKVFNPIPGTQIGSKGYMSARVQPNSPTDNPTDIVWQVFDAWSYGVGDLVLGTNPVSSDPKSVAEIEKALYDVITTFGLEKTISNCVLSHIDVQSEAEKIYPGTSGIWFQSLAGTVNANQTFDVTIAKMNEHMDSRNGQFGLYAETGQGADFTNGHGEGFDMLVHESRKYGFVRALKYRLAEGKTPENTPWVHVNDVAGFIGPEVFKSKEQLVRCCLEDTAMGKLHGLTIGLDVCSTLHMDVTLDDLDWCIEQIMPANPAYLMALPTKNDPMLSYLTTGFYNHVKVREQFGYKINDAMWDFFKKIEIIGEDNKPTANFGDPTWVYYQYRMAKGDLRTREEIVAEGRKTIAEIEDRGVPIAQGFGENVWDLEPELDKKIHALYEDAKESLWTEMTPDFVQSIPAAVPLLTKSKDRKDYVYHPESGEVLSDDAVGKLEAMLSTWNVEIPDIQLVISDGLNARALMDEGHLTPFLIELKGNLENMGYKVSSEPILYTHGRVRAGYATGEVLFGSSQSQKNKNGIVHIIGERPGSGHHNFSAYITAASFDQWNEKGKVDHDITRVVSGISDTALKPQKAALQTAEILDGLFKKLA